MNGIAAEPGTSDQLGLLVIRLRAKGEYLGKAALKAIMKLLGLKPWDEQRLLIRRAA